MNTHGCKIRFDGLEGFHRSVVEAARKDNDFLQRRHEKAVDSLSHHVIRAIRKDVSVPVRLRDMTLRDAFTRREAFNTEIDDYLVWCAQTADADLDTTVWDLDLEVAWAGASYPFECVVEEMAGDEAWLVAELETEHEPVEAWAEALQRGIPLEKVAFLCPGCGNPTRIALDGTGFNPNHGFYCGVCGADSTFEDYPIKATLDAGATWWPFREDPAYDLVQIVWDEDSTTVEVLLREGVPVYPRENGSFDVPVGWLTHALGVCPDLATVIPLEEGCHVMRGYVVPLPNNYRPQAPRRQGEGVTLHFDAAGADCDCDGTQTSFFVSDDALRALHATIGAYLTDKETT